MRIMGLDVGDRRIGVALSDPIGLTAQRLTLIERSGLTRDVDAVCALVKQHDVEALVVGLPLTLRGERGVQAGKVEVLVRHLRRHLTIPIHLIDERLTTVQGQRVLRETGASRRTRKQVIDQIAAQLILQQFLDGQRTPPA